MGFFMVFITLVLITAYAWYKGYQKGKVDMYNEIVEEYNKLGRLIKRFGE